MNILVFSHSCVIPANRDLYKAIQESGDHKVTVLVPSVWKSEYDSSAIVTRASDDSPVDLLAAPVFFPGNINLHTYRVIPEIAWTLGKTDLVLSSQEPYSVSGFQALRLARKLKVPFLFQTNQNIAKSYPFPFSAMEKSAIRQATRALGYSQEAVDVLKQKGRVGPCDVIPYATDIRRFSPGVESELRASLGLGNRRVVGYMGRLIEAKGLDTLLDAFCALPPALRSESAILFVGSGDHEPALRQQVERLKLSDQVVFAGSVPHDQAGKYLRCMDVFVLPSRTTPSWKEQFGRVIIESLASGIPVIGSDSGEIPRLIRKTGGGLVFPEGDRDALTAHLAALLSQPETCRALGETGRLAVEQTYSTDAVARRLSDLCDKSRADFDPAVYR